mmetsp:Transcript_14028/g.22569  ORF Transcript_14028/g.22569 Transcript_14028/m.22569 type:complete len:186 (-) Transcript_14028:241-798(-)|eukprot:CAMPEP_0178781790 /NCGR_PEP_ID=MMETSP0745-20121128/2794_1 /TAXON_ID=913974 /ORGANISM="Nitzschia punctata, Strain CCMP561" /LENGTH=185 /DNA_ID=CAMNT_0020439167 /DNA_START=8 /DNA_END=565 /DNA_ORIENTATION=-
MSTTEDNTNTDYVVADTSGSPEVEGQRKSSTCCGVCDMRIATLFVNGLNIAMLVVGILVASFRSAMFGKTFLYSVGVALPGLILSSLGIFGAITFELWAMYLATAGFLVAFLLDIIMLQWIGLAITALVLVPHIILSYEIRAGIMTKDSYETEEFLIPEGREFVEKAGAYIAPTTESEQPQKETA